MKRRKMTLILLTLAGIVGLGTLLWWLFFSRGNHRIIEVFARVENELITTIGIPVGETPYVHIWTRTGSTVEKAELWDPNGNLIATRFPQDKRGPLDRLSDLISGNSFIYQMDFSLWQPMEGEWQVRIFRAPERSLHTFDLYADATSTIALKVEVGQPQEVGEGHLRPVVARLYRGNELICDENLQIEVEVKVQRSDPPQIHTLQSDDHCVFTGSSGVLTLRESGFYVVAKYGFVRRQQFFYT